MKREVVDRQKMGEKIQAACKAKGIRIAELAERINRPVSHVYRISVGAPCSIPLDTLAAISRELDISVDYLIGIDDPCEEQQEE